jgi:NTE family protein
MRSALVLGGGGLTGIAWELGILHGLADAGVDLTSADTVIGTSSGSVVGLAVTGAVGRGFAAQLEPHAGARQASAVASTLGDWPA